MSLMGGGRRQQLQTQFHSEFLLRSSVGDSGLELQKPALEVSLRCPFLSLLSNTNPSPRRMGHDCGFLEKKGSSGAKEGEKVSLGVRWAQDCTDGQIYPARFHGQNTVSNGSGVC